MEEKAFSPYEKLTILTIPTRHSSPAEVVNDFDKLDLWSERLDSDYPENDINYNEGKPVKSHPFHKISKFYGTKKDAFIFLTTLRSAKMKALILEKLADRAAKAENLKSNQADVIEDYKGKIKTYLRRTAKGEIEAEVFLNDPTLTGFFTGYHFNCSANSRRRNIHENLYINVVSPNQTLETSAYFSKTTPLMKVENSELKKLKIYANGERIMNVVKNDNGMRNYICTKQGNLQLEIGWPAKNSKGEHLFCIVILKFVDGKVVLQEIAVEGEDYKTVVSCAELARQNTGVLVKNKSLHEMLDKLVALCTNEKGPKSYEINCVVQSSLKDTKTHQVKSKEKVIFQLIPNKVPNGEEDVLTDFKKLEFSKGPFKSSDMINYNEGIEANPFDKIAKLYSKQKDVFLFNAVLLDPGKRASVFKMIEEKCDRPDEDQSVMLEQFKKRMAAYVENIMSGTTDAKEVLTAGVNGYFQGCQIAKNGKPRNIHANLIINVNENGQILETSNLFTTVTPKMKLEKSYLERTKVFGNGKRIMAVIKEGKGERNYLFSKSAKMDLNIEWTGQEMRSKREIDCSLTLEVKKGEIALKVASIDGVIVKLATICKYAQANKQVLIQNQSLCTVLEEICKNGGARDPPLTIESMKATIQPAVATEPTSITVSDCKSEETLAVHLLTKEEMRESIEEYIRMKHPLDACMDDFEKLDFSEGPFDPEDKLNYNNGKKESPFNRIRKYYEEKDIFILISVLTNIERMVQIVNVVEQKCSGDIRAFTQFKLDVNGFLEDICARKKFAEAFFASSAKGLFGYFAEVAVEENQPKSSNAYLNVEVIDTSRIGMALEVSDFFQRPLPPEMKKEELEGMTIFGDYNRLVDVAKMGPGQRNYVFAKAARMILEVKWNAKEIRRTYSSCMKEKECLMVFKIVKGEATISKATLDGLTVQAASILELAKQNDKVFINGKSLYDNVYCSCLQAVIKGATTLFFTAASAVGGGDATNLNNSCTDVFLMLMLQDEDERERILEMVSKQSPKPDVTRKQFLNRMAIFKKKFANGDYTEEEENDPSYPQAAANGSATAEAPDKAKQLKSSTGDGSDTGEDGKGSKTGTAELTLENLSEATLQPSTSTHARKDATAANQTGPDVQVKVVSGEGVRVLCEDDDDGSENGDDDNESDDAETQGESLILLGAESYPIELLRNANWTAFRQRPN